MMSDEAENLTDLINEAEAPELTAVEPVAEEANGNNLDLILDIPLRVTVELGRSKMVVS